MIVRSQFYAGADSEMKARITECDPTPRYDRGVKFDVDVPDCARKYRQPIIEYVDQEEACLCPKRSVLVFDGNGAFVAHEDENGNALWEINQSSGEPYAVTLAIENSDVACCSSTSVSSSSSCCPGPDCLAAKMILIFDANGALVHHFVMTECFQISSKALFINDLPNSGPIEYRGVRIKVLDRHAPCESSDDCRFFHNDAYLMDFDANGHLLYVQRVDWGCLCDSCLRGLPRELCLEIKPQGTNVSSATLPGVPSTCCFARAKLTLDACEGKYKGTITISCLEYEAPANHLEVEFYCGGDDQWFLDLYFRPGAGGAIFLDSPVAGQNCPTFTQEWEGVNMDHSCCDAVGDDANIKLYECEVSCFDSSADPFEVCCGEGGSGACS